MIEWLRNCNECARLLLAQNGRRGDVLTMSASDPFPTLTLIGLCHRITLLWLPAMPWFSTTADADEEPMTNVQTVPIPRTTPLRRRLRWIGAAALMAACLPQAALADDFYAGKRITYIASGSAGGGYDLLARATARHLGKHIPGNPTVVVQNMSSGSLVVPNLMFNTAPKDGTTIALVQRTMLHAMFTHPGGVRFDMAKFNWLGSLNSETGVTVAWHTGPHRAVENLFEKEMIVGSVGSGADNEATPKIYNSLLGTKFKVITGYAGTPQMAIAMERGEVQGIGDWAWTSIKAIRPDWLRDKKILLLMQGALKRNSELGNVPFAFDFIKNNSDHKLLELYFTAKTAARPVLAPPEVPADRVTILRKAFAALSQDREFLAEVSRTKLDFEFVPGGEIDKIAASIVATPPDVASRFVNALGEVR